ncbi:MAG: Wzy polymerase domain-containing protein [Rubrivivax sp.]|nr:Wzy polymerase domain-containing protein [Rubrivivax sp.]
MGLMSFRGDAVIGLLYGVGVGLCIYVGYLWSAQNGTARVQRLMCLVIVVSALAANGLALVQWLRLGPPGWWAMELIDDRPYANLAQPNHFGLLMVMAVVSVTALFESAAVKSRGVYVLAVAYFGWGVHISQSRASALAVIAIVALWLLTRKRIPTRLRLGFVLPATLAWCLLAFGFSPLQEALLLESAGFRTPAEVGARHWIWLHFWEAITQRPWAGYGFNQGVLALSEVADRVHPSRNVIFAHNVVLDLMTWFGIPLALTFTGALGLWMSGWLRRQPDPSFMVQRHIVFALWLALVVQSMLEFPFAHSYFLLPLALMAGAVTPAPRLQQEQSASGPTGASRGILVLAVATAATLGLLGWEYFQQETEFRLRRFERANLGSTVDRAAFSEPLILDQLAALNASSRIVVSAGMPVDQLDAMRTLARRFHILSTRMDYAKALALNGRLAEAEHELIIIRSVYDETRGARIEREWRTWLAAAARTGEQTEQAPVVDRQR